MPTAISSASNCAAPALAEAIVLAEVTRDGRLDILTSNSVLGGFSGFVNPGNGVFESPRTFAAFRSTEIAIADLNGDGKPDVVVTDGSGLITASLNAA